MRPSRHRLTPAHGLIPCVGRDTHVGTCVEPEPTTPAATLAFHRYHRNRESFVQHPQRRNPFMAAVQSSLTGMELQ
jgi:hypothetical protein